MYFCTMSKSPIVIIGAGPAGLMAAQYLAEKGFEVHVFEQNKAAARKFLVAGHGGFNLTHSEAIVDFVQRYDKENLHAIIHNFDNTATIQWLNDLGIQTYVGSSGKIFPNKEIKPIQVLKAWLNKLNSLGVRMHYEHQFIDFDDQYVSLMYNDNIIKTPYDKLLLALGGGSWKKTGSNAKWVDILTNKNIKIVPLESANSGYNTVMDVQEFEGQNLKNIELRFQETRKKGELVFTSYGIEGSPTYYLNRFTRLANLPIQLNIDLKPILTEEQIIRELQNEKNTTKVLKERLKLNSTAINLLKKLPKEVYINPVALSYQIKNYSIYVKSLRPMDEVISTSGGIDFSELYPSLNLIKQPNVYCLGEMLDWEAPTGGYLLQACFSMGVWVANHIYK